jgi:hypothetical protein
MEQFRRWKQGPVTATLIFLLLAASASLGLSACTGGDRLDSTLGGGNGEQLGAARLALQIAPGTSVGAVGYAISGPGGFSKTGTVDVAHATTLSVVVGAVPAGQGYVVSLTATTLDGAISCAGSATFDVTARAVTAVTVHLTCHETPRTGSVAVDGTINVCPAIDGVSANPGEVVVGYPVALAVAASDADRGPSALAYHWTVSSGALDDAASPSPTFTCLDPGPATITVAVSDGDPLAACADSATLAVTCSAAGPQTYAWTAMASGGQAIARVVTPDSSCPAIVVDGHTQPMNLRVAAGTIPLRTTASTPDLSKPSAFPVTTCELPIPAGATSVVVAGRALPLPKARPNRIVVVGDTGCRMKVGNPFQACSDPNEWPFAQIADSATKLAPDLVLSVGDYHYRENPCPADIAGCQGSPWGYGWDVWEQDWFKPAAGLMAVAPMVLARGNHEECARGGQGWFRFLDTLPYDASRSCDDPANDDIANYNTPYAVPLGDDAQVILFDSAKIGAALAPTSPIFARYQAQFRVVESLAANPSVFSIFTNHHPILGFTAAAGGPPSGGSPGLISVLAATYPGTYFPPNIKLVLEGHNHVFEAINFATSHPIHILSGNGGDNLDVNLPDPFPLGPAASGGVEPAPGAVVDQIAHMSSFGFLVLDRAPGGWTARAYKRDGTLMDTCAIDAATDKISCATLGFLH